MPLTLIYIRPRVKTNDVIVKAYVVRAFTRCNNKTSEHCIRRGMIRTIAMNECMTAIKRRKTTDTALSVLLNQRARRYS